MPNFRDASKGFPSKNICNFGLKLFLGAKPSGICITFSSVSYGSDFYDLLLAFADNNTDFLRAQMLISTKKVGELPYA